MSFRAEITTDSIALFDGDEELVYWDAEEIINDPSLPFTIANAINIGHTEGPDGVRVRLITS